MPERQRVTFVQYAGDFREASERLASGGDESYRGQAYTVEYVQSLAATHDVVTLACLTESSYDVTLPGGVRAIGLGPDGLASPKRIQEVVAGTSPDLLVLRTPSRRILFWAAIRRKRTLLLLADSYNTRSLKGRLALLLLVLATRLPNVELVANHGRAAAEQLATGGVPARKLLSWDYPAFDTPQKHAEKVRPGSPAVALFVGNLAPEKGPHDLVRALASLRAEGIDVVAQIVGGGPPEALHQQVQELEMQEYVSVVGPRPNREIIDLMAASDLVVVPSRLDCAEGLPLTIYEAYCARTPLVVSDHPMFVNNVVDGASGLVYEAGNSLDLANAMKTLLADERLYAHLSRNSAEAWQRLQIPVKWADVLQSWLDGPDATSQLLTAHSVAASGIRGA